MRTDRHNDGNSSSPPLPEELLRKEAVSESSAERFSEIGEYKKEMVWANFHKSEQTVKRSFPFLFFLFHSISPISLFLSFISVS